MSQNNVFDSIESMSLTGQVTSLRAIANGAICGAVFAMHTFLTTDDANVGDDARQRAISQCELYTYTCEQLAPLVQTEFDKAMTLDQAIDFACSNASDRGTPQELDDETLKALGITRQQLTVIDAQERKKQVERDTKLRASYREHARGIKDELASELGNPTFNAESGRDVVDNLSDDAHNALFQKVSKKLAARIQQVIGLRNRYDGALADAMLLNADRVLLDKHYVAFLKTADLEARREPMAA